MRVVVCGTGFGRVHMQAVLSAPDLELAGVLSRGSEASRRVAEEHGVPCWTSVSELPDDVDLACVAVPSGTGAGDGADLARQLMTRGIHVLQEHPLHPNEIADCLRAARKHGVQYRVNTLYPHVGAVRDLLVAAERLRARHRPLFLDAACGVQVLYSLLDVLARAAGKVRPSAVGDPHPIPAEVTALATTPAPWSSLQGVLGGVPLTLRVQNELKAADPDNHALLLHRVSIGFDSGVLSLADTHGPVLWSPRLHSTRDKDGRLVLDGSADERLRQRSTDPVGTDPIPSFAEVFSQTWPDAVGLALAELCRDVAEPDGAAATQAAQWALSIATLWQEVSGRLGPVRLVDPPEPALVRVAELRR